MSIPTIIYVRHGETDWNKQGLIQGSVETELNAAGHEQAKAIGALLAFRKDEWNDYQIIVSPQLRTRQTAAHILEALGRSDESFEPRVRELGFGVWEGKPFWELKAFPLYPADPEGHFNWRPDGGESYADGLKRVNEWRATLDRPTIVISHGAIGRCLMADCANLLPQQLVTLKTPQGAYCRLEQGQIHWFDGVDDPA